jgi:hypothetical protein
VGAPETDHAQAHRAPRRSTLSRRKWLEQEMQGS